MSARPHDTVLMLWTGGFEWANELGQRFELKQARSLNSALAFLKSETPQIVLIADDLPEARALTLLRALVPLWQGPYVLLADASREVAEDIISLEAGFDDVWQQNIDPRLALARARVLLRRWTHAADASLGSLHAFGIALDRTRRTLAFQQRELMLAPREANVLAVLLRHTGRVVERSAFAAAGVAVSPAAVDVTVARLRQRLAVLGAQHVRIEPVRGRGYCLRLRETAAAASGINALRRRG